jgi:serine/threonine protein kinase
MSLPRPKRLYRITEPGQQPQEGLLSSTAASVTSITSFLTLVFELDVHLFCDSFHAKLRPARAGEGGTFSVRHFQLQFDDLGFNQTDMYDDGRPMRGGNLSRGHRVITKHVTVQNDDPRSTTLDDAKVLKPLVQELRVLAHPPLRDHSNIIDLFGVAWEKQLDYFGQSWPILVLEYAPGGNLMEFLGLNHPETTWSTSLRISQHIASGLSSLHACGVIHADLKPENVLIIMEIEDRPVAKICDFGFAIIKSDYLEAESSQTLQVQLAGFTPRWLAPEGRQGIILLDQAHMIDVYAFGLIFAVIAMGGNDPLAVEVSTESSLLA